MTACRTIPSDLISTLLWLVCWMTCLPGQTFGQGQLAADGTELVYVNGGSFLMGDTKGEGGEEEQPTHSVQLTGFWIAKHEVTVSQFRRFVTETGYTTSAELPVNRQAQDSLLQLAARGEGLSFQARRALVDETLLFGGCNWWDRSAGRFGFDENLSWKAPGFDLEDLHPAVCLSWEDAAHYVNWLSRIEGLPEAYDVGAGALLDSTGRPTSDITSVMGYRLPTEAEWEFSAREGGNEVRFGNGLETASARTASFDAASGEYSYLIPGPERAGPTPVGAFPANALGLFDMAGNAWEWVHDTFSPYPELERVNPIQSDGRGRVVRGGRWGGDAEEMRATKRLSWQANNRCNASGFRLARSNPSGHPGA